MKRKEVLIAVIGGCFGALVTMGVGLFSPVRVGAQSQNQDAVFGKITCTEIEVIDSLGERRCIMFSDKYGGSVEVHGKGKGRAVMGSDEHGGRVGVFGKGKGEAGMHINEYGNGAISTWDKNGYRQ